MINKFLPPAINFKHMDDKEISMSNLVRWLNDIFVTDNAPTALHITIGDRRHRVFVDVINDSMLCLYHEYFYIHNNSLPDFHKSKTEYAGFYVKGKDVVYDLGYALKELIADSDSYDSYSMEMLDKHHTSQLQVEVSKLLEDIPSDKIEQTINNHDDNDKYSINEKAVELFINGIDTYTSNLGTIIYDIEFRWLDTLIDYLIDENEITTQAKIYFEKYTDNLTKYVAYGVAVNRRLEELQIESLVEGNVLGKRRDIMAAMKETDAKSVYVSFIINGERFDTKMNSDNLRRSVKFDNRIGSHDFPAPDRLKQKDFMESIGKKKYDDFNTSDIAEITFRNKTIYKDGHLNVEA